MKIRMDFGKATLVRPSYDMLMATLQAQQATTPTALASVPARSAGDAKDALVRLFGDADRAGPLALDGSFNPKLHRQLAGEPER